MFQRSMHRALAFAILSFVGCGSDQLEIQPTAPTPAAAPLPPGISLRGQVNDTAFRPLPGVRMEIVDGPRAGTTAVTDDAGGFLMEGTFSIGALTVSASKDGYLSATQRVTLNENQPPNSWSLWFLLEAVALPINLAGQYTLTLTADTTCNRPAWESALGWGLPIEAATRTYTAAIAPRTRSTSFLGTLTDATAVNGKNTFSVGVAGDFATFSFDGFDNPALVEVLSDTGYLAIDGSAGASVTASTITAAFEGYFQYCPREKALISGNHYQCSTATPVASVTCSSRNHRFTLTRR